MDAVDALPQYGTVQQCVQLVAGCLWDFTDAAASDGASDGGTSGGDQHDDSHAPSPLPCCRLHFLKDMLAADTAALQLAARCFDDCVTDAGSEPVCLRVAPHVLAARAGGWAVLGWHPKYASTVLVCIPANDTAQAHVHVLGLDGWRFHVAPGGTHSAAASHQPTLVQAGTVPSDQLKVLWTLFKRILTGTEDNTGDRRSAENPNGGNQKTPSFLIAVLKAALRLLPQAADIFQDSRLSPQEIEKEISELLDDAEIEPQGGFTDVGCHTGNAPRNTSWSLVAATLWHLLHVQSQPPLQEPALLFELTLTEIEADHLLEEHSSSTSLVSADACDTAMRILRSVSRKAAALAESGRVPEAWLAAIAADVEAAHVRIVEAAQAMAARQADSYAVQPPSLDRVRAVRSPAVVPSLTAPFGSAAGQLKEARRRALLNLAWVPHVPAPITDASAVSTSTMTGLIDQYKKRLTEYGGAEAGAAALPVITAFLNDAETWIFRTLDGVVRDAVKVQEGAIRGIIDVCIAYCAAVDQLVAVLKHKDVGGAAVDGGTASLMAASLRSRKVLVVWTTYCLIHDAATFGPYKQLKQFACAPDPADLQLLVLPEPPLQAACFNVCAYLNRFRSGPTPFSGRADHRGHTDRLADAVASVDPVLQARVAQETQKAARRKRERFANIKAQQERVRIARNTLQGLEAEVARIRSGGLISSYDHHRLDRALEAVRAAEQNLRSLRTPPLPLLLPLPQQPADKARALFYVHMPFLLQKLHYYSYFARYVLSFQTADDAAVDKAPNGWTNLASVYNGRDPHSDSTTSDDFNFMIPKPPDEDRSRSSVEEYYSEEDGVLYVPPVSPAILWKVRQNVNPFVASRTSLVPLYTAKAKPLTWALQLHEHTAATRANKGIANQDSAAATLGLNKPAYLAFCSLRTYPMKQIRELCAVLHDRLLPLTQPAVQALVRQVLYHVGPLSSGTATSTTADSLTLEWKADFYDSQVKATLLSELEHAVTEVAEAPTQADALPVLAEAAVHLSELHGEKGCDPGTFAAVSRAAAAAFVRWADEKAAELAAAENSSSFGTPQLRSALRASQRRFLVGAVQAYGATGYLSPDDAAQLIKLRVRIQMMQPLHGEEARAPSNIAAAQHVLSARITAGALQLLAEKQGRLDAALTASARCVISTLPASGLVWAPVAGANGDVAGLSTSCYETVVNQHNLVSINALNGTVLFNGLPPNYLPASVTSHPLYARAFGQRNAPVVLDARGVMKSTQPLAGRFYEFYQDSSANTLTVYELEEVAGAEGDIAAAADDSSTSATTACTTTTRRWRLLNNTTDTAYNTYCRELPVRLQTLHCHWLCESHGVVAIRPLPYSDRRIEYLCVGVAPSTAGGAATTSVFEVPAVHATAPLEQLLPLCAGFDRLLHSISASTASVAAATAPGPLASTIRILSKFEDKRYIHVFWQPSTPASTDGGVCRFSLPRYHLDFHLHADGRLESSEYRGYALAPVQQLGDTLAGFTQYLVLHALKPDSVSMMSRPRMLLLVPAGEVSRKAAGGAVTIAVSSGASDHIPHVSYSEHRRFSYLKAATVEARLQLCALYAACSRAVPEARTGLRGAETAVQLARNCWQNRPLTQVEQERLANVFELSTHIPALRLLCFHLQRSSEQLSFLHLPLGASDEDLSAVDKRSPLAVSLCSDASAEYTLQIAVASASVRERLTPAEELAVLGSCPRAGNGASGLPIYTASAAGWSLPPCDSSGTLELADHGIDPSIVTRMEALLINQLCAAQPVAADPSPFPLASQTCDTAIARAMLDELADSWRVHWSTPENKLTVPLKQARVVVAECAITVAAKVKALEAWLAAALTPPATAYSFRMRRAAGEAPTFTLTDALRLGLLANAAAAAHFNPALSRASREQVSAGANLWMQLCVLQDRLARIDARLKELDTPPAVDAAATSAPAGNGALVEQAVREICTRRVWDPVQHPSWLVFEVEGQLQIRPPQYSIITDILKKCSDDTPRDDAGCIAQLNMGEGKTRVIVPCLLLHWQAQAQAQAQQRQQRLGPAAAMKQVTRVYFLTQLLDEAFGFLHSTLTASALDLRLLQLPFHRDVQLTPQRARAMGEAVQYCASVGGALIVAPEHTLSLQLKWHDMRMRRAAIGAGTSTGGGGGGSVNRQQSEMADTMKQLQHLFALPYTDLYDESDEILRHRRQLVYAVGVQQGLPSGKHRWQVLQAVLHLLRHNGAVRATLAGEGVSVRQAGVPDHEFDGLQLLPGDARDAAVPAFVAALVDALVTDPPRELAWINQVSLAVRDKIAPFITDAGTDAESILSPSDLQDRGQYDALLMLRGLISHGLLLHCLSKRHRVDYGIPRGDAHKHRIKRIAVPFRAADTPSLRSEFAQPDVLLAFTILAYYHDGLDRDQLREALASLQQLGTVARRQEYASWYALVKPSIADAKEAAAIDSVDKLDSSNGAQFDVLMRHFARCTRTVAWWLNTVVLPRDTKVYPHRLLASPWHLTGASLKRGGFSGTVDFASLLPLAVAQHPPSDATLRGTDGRMLQALLKRATFHSLPAAAEGGSLQHLLDLALGSRADTATTATASTGGAVTAAAVTVTVADALLDAGALTAGYTNEAVADAILRRLQQARDSGGGAAKHRGVVYDSSEERRWMVLDLHWRRLPLESSSIQPRDAFAFFDEARCRGADLQLRPDAVAVLTLCPKLCKDSLMQAAGRMRGLHYGQSLVVAAQAEVTAMIAATAGTAASAVDMTAVLAYVTACSAEAAAGGVSQWARHGLHYADTATALPAPGTHTHARSAGAAAAAAAALQAADAMQLPESVDLMQLYGAGQVAMFASEAFQRSITSTRGLSQVPASDATVPAAVSADAPPVPAAAASPAAVTTAATAPAATTASSLMEVLKCRVEALGADVQVTSSAQDEECEREVEREVQAQEEVQRQVPEQTPAEEVQWDYAAALTKDSVLGLSSTAGVGATPLATFIAANCRPAKQLSAPAWAASRVWGTHNYFNTITPPATAATRGVQLNEYLRPPSFLLYYPADGSVLLLCDGEAEALLRLYQQRQRSGGYSYSGDTSNAPMLLQLAYLRHALQAAQAGHIGSGAGDVDVDAILRSVQMQMRLPPPAPATQTLAAAAASAPSEAERCAQLYSTLVALQLFAGETMFGRVGSHIAGSSDSASAAALWRLLAAPGATAGAELLPSMRGTSHLFDRSHLHEVCTAIDAERHRAAQEAAAALRAAARGGGQRR